MKKRAKMNETESKYTIEKINKANNCLCFCFFFMPRQGILTIERDELKITNNGNERGHHHTTCIFEKTKAHKVIRGKDSKRISKQVYVNVVEIKMK